MKMIMRNNEKSNISHALNAGLSSMGLGGVRDIALPLSLINRL